MSLYLLPNLLHETASMDASFPPQLHAIIPSLQGLFAESEKEARRYLRKFVSHEKMAAIPLRLLNEHTDPKDLDALLEPLIQGETWGLISDAGLPCIADPGKDLVGKAHEKNIEVHPIVGPSSLLMALQISGFCGQKFSFQGYLPREPALLEKKLVELEAISFKEGSSQLWIEAPYRSAKMLETLLRSLSPTTKLCVAVELMSSNERYFSASIASWKKGGFSLGKELAVFVLFSPPKDAPKHA